jgi:adenylosuccinate synthase
MKALSADIPRYSSVIGLGFGDCGKGVFTDYLCREFRARTVVRFNGGAQAGHNVVLPDGTHHTFSQFGSGTFIPGVFTVLIDPVVVHPTALLCEYEALRNKGAGDALDRLLIDGRCRIITPYHQAAGRIRELIRGAGAHGSCGTGFGETVKHSIEHPEETLTYGEIADESSAMTKLEAIRRSLLDETLEQAGDFTQPVIDEELSVLRDESVSKRWLDLTAPLTAKVPPSDESRIAERLHLAGRIVFEGAQGMLLDEWKGFHPHTTWSSVHAGALDEIAARLALPESVTHFGAVRTYMTRHGNGPLPTHDPGLSRIPEPHNGNEGWQGDFRRGHPDSVLLRYALANAGNISALLVSHNDIFDHGISLKWCRSYMSEGKEIPDIPITRGNDLAEQESLTGMIFQAQPVYDGEPVTTANRCISLIEESAEIPVSYMSFGVAYPDVKRRV